MLTMAHNLLNDFGLSLERVKLYTGSVLHCFEKSVTAKPVGLHDALDLIQSHFRDDEPLFTLKHEEYNMDINLFLVYN